MSQTPVKTDDTYMGFDEARSMVERSVKPLAAERIDLDRANGLVLASDAVALVDSPSVDASTRDGFAVIAADLEAAGEECGVLLAMIGSATAGKPWTGTLQPGTAVRITTGAALPAGADAVVMSECCELADTDNVLVRDRPGFARNVILRGSDVRAGHAVAAASHRITPGVVGLLAAAGIDLVAAVPLPRVALLAVGDEVVLPGNALQEGQLYASNLAYLSAWLRLLAIEHSTAVIGDDRQTLQQALLQTAGAHVVITSGGAWSSHRDLVIPALEDLGWTQIFHRVRMGPGAGTAFGRYGEQLIFCLPGGPPSSAIGFLQLALPCLLRLAGRVPPFLPTTRAQLVAPVMGRRPGWTEFAHARIEQSTAGQFVEPLQSGSRLARIAAANCLLQIPEGVGKIESGTDVEVELLAATS